MQNIYAILVNLAMHAEAECYNPYALNGILKTVQGLGLHYDYVMNFWKGVGDCGKRLFLEFCFYSNQPIDKSNISFKI